LDFAGLRESLDAEAHCRYRFRLVAVSARIDLPACTTWPRRIGACRESAYMSPFHAFAVIGLFTSKATPLNRSCVYFERRIGRDRVGQRVQPGGQVVAVDHPLGRRDALYGRVQRRTKSFKSDLHT
jgi:hypothetical protein